MSGFKVLGGTILGAALGGAVILIIIDTFGPLTPANELNESQRIALTQKIRTEIVYGQLLYKMDEVPPPGVAFTVADPRNAAESECLPDALESGDPAWMVRVNERMAAKYWRRYIRETIPHEVAHLLLCQMRGYDWHLHDWQWESIVRDMGATPMTQHRYHLEEQ